MNTKITQTHFMVEEDDRMNPRILLLALGIFAIATEGFVIAGLLPTIASDLGVAVCEVLALGLLFLGTHFAHPRQSSVPVVIPIAASR